MRFRIYIKFAECGLRKAVELPFMPSKGMMIDPFPAGRNEVREASRPLEVSSAIWNLEDCYGFVVLDGTMFDGLGPEYLLLTRQGWEGMPW